MPEAVHKPRSATLRWTHAIALLVLILGTCIAVGQMLARRVADLTPEELRTRIATNSPPPLEKVIEQFNRMTVLERRELTLSENFRDYTAKLKPDERHRFVRETMDRGIQDQIQRFRKMNKEERAAFVEEAKERQKKAREEMENLPPEKKEQLRAQLQSGNMQEVIERAVQEFLKVTTSEERAELAPLYDGALENLSHAKNLK